MSNLIYSTIASLDGYTADVNGNFNWSAPDEEVHAYVNDLERNVGTYLYGRRMYEVMVAWEDWDVADEPDVIRDYAALWRAADKIVFSTSLTSPRSANTTIAGGFDPEYVRELKRTSVKDLSIGGPMFAAAALRAGLVDELHQLVSPVVVGGGTAALPDDLNLALTLLGTHAFTNGVVDLHYAINN